MGPRTNKKVKNHCSVATNLILQQKKIITFLISWFASFHSSSFWKIITWLLTFPISRFTRFHSYSSWKTITWLITFPISRFMSFHSSSSWKTITWLLTFPDLSVYDLKIFFPWKITKQKTPNSSEILTRGSFCSARNGLKKKDSQQMLPPCSQNGSWLLFNKDEVNEVFSHIQWGEPLSLLIRWYWVLVPAMGRFFSGITTPEMSQGSPSH